MCNQYRLGKTRGETAENFGEILNRRPEAFGERHARLPAEQVAGFGNVRLALPRVVFGEGRNTISPVVRVNTANVPGEFQHGYLARVSEVHGVTARRKA